DPMARAGPEPSTLYFLPLPSSAERLQPAYCEARQASTGCAVCTVTKNAQELSVSAAASDTLPRPPRQISAIRRPASSPPTTLTPQSTRHSPSVPSLTSTRSASASAMSALTRGSALALTLVQALAALRCGAFLSVSFTRVSRVSSLE